MEKLDSDARLLIERLEAAGWAALPVIAPSGLAPPQPPASADVAAATRPSVSGQPAVAPFAPPVSPKPTAPATTSALPRPVPPVATADWPTLTLPDTQRLRLGDVFPFRWIDFVLPIAASVLVLLFGRDDGDDIAVIVGGTLLVFVLVLAMTGLIVFPLRYYRRRSNPYRVARNLVISNVVFALGGAVAGILIAKSVAEEGQSINEVRAYTAASFVLLGLLIAAISFAIFALLSRFRARKTYQEGFERL